MAGLPGVRSRTARVAGVGVSGCGVAFWVGALAGAVMLVCAVAIVVGIWELGRREIEEGRLKE